MLYHYTDYVAFDGIIRCGELRLNNILNMNDASEMRLFMHGICKAVVDRLNVEGEFEKAQQIENFFQKELAKEFHYSAYAACFSKYRDDAAQWERYANYGQGVCIAFHEKLLQKNDRRCCFPTGSILSGRYARKSARFFFLSFHERNTEFL